MKDKRSIRTKRGKNRAKTKKKTTPRAELDDRTRTMIQVAIYHGIMNAELRSWAHDAIKELHQLGIDLRKTASQMVQGQGLIPTIAELQEYAARVRMLSDQGLAAMNVPPKSAT